MKITSLHCIASFLVVLSMVTAPPVEGADRTWNGGGNDNLWSTPANWGGTAPASGDSLFFGGSVRLNPANNFPAGTLFNGLTFNNPSASFTLGGNGITLGAAIADNMPLVPQVINLPLSLNATRVVSVAADGSLTLVGVISGSAGAGLTKTGSGLLTLSAANTFNGVVTINNGILSIASDGNLGAAPAAPTPGRIVINGGALRSTANFTLSANRGIALGDSGSSGVGTLAVGSGATVIYNGIIANNGGTGGLNKGGFGALTLAGANSYTGPTIIKNGTLTLDFAPAGAPVNNMISSSALTVGGENAGLGAVTFGTLVMNAKAATVNGQTFAGTTIDIGPAVLRANGNGGTANLTLGALAHNPGGALNVVPPGANAGLGAITTTTPNLNGILGAWATYGNGSAPVGSVTIGTDWASVDGSGRIGAYAGYTDYTSGNLHGAVSAGTNLRITAASHPGGAALAYRVNDENAGTVTDINTVAIQNAVQGDTLVVGTGNTLRLGRFGGIFRQDSTTANTVLYFGGVGGTQSGNGTAGSQGIGTITAGGADNTPGEIVFTVNAPSQTQGSFIVEPTITDNGSGAVTVVKVGPGSMKLDGNNTYSGGTYLLQGRVQLAGSEVGTGNPGGFGSGPVLVLPGAYAFLSGIGDFAVTGVGVSNNFSIAGLGLQNEQVGAIRFGNGARLFGDVTLIGDARIGGGNAATLPNTGISGKISGPFNLDLGALQTINTFLSLFNPANDWSGQTTMNARNTATANSIRNGASEVIPHGIGKGNVTLNGNTSTGTITWDLNGFNETINGLISAGNLAGCIIINNAASTTSTLTVGDYDQTASYGGIIQSGAGTVALRKIGGGRQTLTGVNSYTGNTEVNGGTLALSGSGSIASTPLISVNGGAFDVSEVSGGFTHTSPIEITSGAFVIRTTTSPGINSLTLTDSRLRVANLGAAPVIVETATLTTGGTSNVIDIASVGTISSYPAQFTIIKYTGTIGGAGFNFGLGDVPTPSTAGYISNNVDNSSVDLVLLDGPKPLTWTGLLGPAWDINTTVNWLAFGVTPSVYLDVDSVRFDDTGASGTVNLTTNLLPGAVVVDNTAREYTFTGPGKISGPAGLTKAGTGSLILSQTGTNDYFGPVAINGGTVQVGNNNAAGNLGGGSVANAGALTFARTDTHTVPNAISGAGSLTQNGSGTLVLSGNSTYTGPTTVSQGTLKPGSGSALGAVDSGTVVSSGTTLDVNGQNLGAEPVTVSGGGIGGNGAIINTGGGQNNALQVVTLAGDTVFGGTDRWDIRAVGGVGSLNSGGFGYSITKVGSNQVSLVGLGTVDPMLGNIEVQQGVFSLETSTVQLGDQFSIVTVHGGAVLNLFNLNPSGLNKLILLKDGSLLRNENGMSAVHSVVTTETGNITIHGTGTGTTPMFTFNNVISGPGNLFKIGTGPVTLAAQQNDYSGTTTVSNGQVYVDGSVIGGGAWTVYATLGGIGTISSPVTIASGGTLAPGNPGNPIETLEITGVLTLNGTNVMDLNTANFTAPNDVVNFATTINFGGVLRLNNTGPALVSGDSFVLYSFGAATGAFSSIIPSTPGTGLRWDTNSLYMDGVLRVAAVAQPNISGVTQSGGNIVLSGAGGSAGANYFVLSSTNIALPVASWTRILTNSFDGSGNFNLSIPIDPGTPHRFFLLQPE